MFQLIHYLVLVFHISLINSSREEPVILNQNTTTNIQFIGSAVHDSIQNKSTYNSTLLRTTGHFINENFNLTDQTKILTQREIAKPTVKEEASYNEDIRLFLPPDRRIIVEAIQKLKDEICKEHVLLTLNALNERRKWALQMLDSSAKFPESVLTGSFYQMGNYDECVSIKVDNDNGGASVKGQYCLADVQPKERKVHTKKLNTNAERNELNSTLHWAICLPHSCKPKEVGLILKYIVNGIIGNADAVSVNVKGNKCYFKNEDPITTFQMAYGYVIVAFLSVIFLATLYHVILYYRKKEDKTTTLEEIILSFSVIRNVRKLLHCTKSELNLSCIAGIKAISMPFIIASHSLTFMFGGPIVNVDFAVEAVQKVENAIFLNSPLLVDTFLLISGFLMCRLLLLELDKREGKVNVLLLYIFRYIRLTPVYLVIIGFYCTWLVRLDEGPLWKSRITTERDRCLHSWWTNILYINNYIDVDNLCMFQSWYLAVDTQLFMLAPIIIYPLWKWRKFGEFFLGFSTVILIIIPFIITYSYRLDPTQMVFVPELEDISKNWYYIHAYIKTHMRASSYCFGLVFGYIIHRIQLANYKLPKVTLILGWILGLFCLIASMFSVTVFYTPNHVYNALEAASYAALHRGVWCIGVGWIIIVCVTDNSGPIQKFLCWKPFIPLSRLTYCAYLVNGLIELHYSASVRQPKYLSIYSLAIDVVAHTVLTFVAAFVLSILFESPIISCEKVLLRKERRRKQDTEQQTT